ncbi:MAG: (d)CMP kinase [Clostridia bacterium]|nr:(d)CMP kinase [Clostridia bacterium]
MNIAIDGPAGAGKSTIAKILANKMKILYLDTGAMYRGVAYYIIKKGINPEDREKVEIVLDEISMDIKYHDNIQSVWVNGENISPFIRENYISMAASTVSKYPKVRLKLVEIQREIAEKSDCVLDGRDIGTFVLPKAEYKIFLTASPEVRANRRYLELIDRGQKQPYNQILEEIVTRDYQDTHRDFAPLKQAEDAILLDTSDLSIEEVARSIENICKF